MGGKKDDDLDRHIIPYEGEPILESAIIVSPDCIGISHCRNNDQCPNVSLLAPCETRGVGAAVGLAYKVLLTVHRADVINIPGGL